MGSNIEDMGLRSVLFTCAADEARAETALSAAWVTHVHQQQ